MKVFLTLFFIICFPIFIFFTTILYTPDITPLLKAALVKNNIYHQLSTQLEKIDTGNGSSALLGQFIQNKFTSDYLQQKVEKAMNDSDDWITNKSQTPPVISFKDVKNDLNAQYPQLLPAIEQASEQMKQEETQNPQLQQNSQATNELNLITNLAKSDFTIPLNNYLVGLKNFYTTVRRVQPILGILLVLSLVLQCAINKTWKLRLKWLGVTLLLSSAWGFILTYSNAVLIAIITKYLAANTNHAIQVAMPIILQLINHYINAYSSYQKNTSIGGLILAICCFFGMAVTRKSSVAPVKSNKIRKRK